MRETNRICLLCGSSNQHVGNNEDIWYSSGTLRMNSTLYIREEGKKTQNLLHCLRCGKICRSKMKIYFHISTHTWKFQCNLCKKVCSTNQQLQRHMKTHTRDHSYTCNICSKTCKKKYEISGCMEVPSGSKHLVCNMHPCRKHTLNCTLRDTSANTGLSVKFDKRVLFHLWPTSSQ